MFSRPVQLSALRLHAVAPASVALALELRDRSFGWHTAAQWVAPPAQGWMEEATLCPLSIDSEPPQRAR